MQSRTRSTQMRTRRVRRIKAQTRQRRTWPPIQTTQRSTHQPPLPAISRTHLRRTRAMALTSHPTRVRMIRVTDSSRLHTLPNRRRRCPTTISRRLPATTISGRPAIGPGLHRAITGYPVRGLKHRTKVHSGPPVTGASGITVMAFTVAIGAGTSATMAASTTALAISASAMRAVTGVVATSTTTVRSTTSTCRTCTTSTIAMWAGTAGAALV